MQFGNAHLARIRKVPGSVQVDAGHRARPEVDDAVDYQVIVAALDGGRIIDLLTIRQVEHHAQHKTTCFEWDAHGSEFNIIGDKRDLGAKNGELVTLYLPGFLRKIDRIGI